MSKKKDRKKDKDKGPRRDRKKDRRRTDAGEPCPGGKDCASPKRHLCRLAKAGDLEAVRALARGAAFLCARCGRAARSAASLCRPEKL